MNRALQGHLSRTWWQDKLFQLRALLSIRACFWPWSVVRKPPPTHCPPRLECLALHALLVLHASLRQGQGRSKLQLLAQQAESWAGGHKYLKSPWKSAIRSFIFSRQTIICCYLLPPLMPAAWHEDAYWCHTWLRSGEDLIQAYTVTGNSVSWFASYLLSPLSFPLPFMIS